LFNQATYTVNGATGSVKKFFYESSYTKLNLSVTVAGPYTASNTVAYYGGNDSAGDDLRPRELVTEAVNLADPVVNYADFDNDADGSVDGVYVIYAGYGEESGGSPDYIWAHAWNIPTITRDGKTISRYSCSPELAGSSGSYITNIGVICHEYGHILGAPDFYDTDYEDNGQYPGTGNWDLQSSGVWNNAGKTPAQPNAYTKCYVYDWATATDITTLGSTITIQNSSVQNTDAFYRMNTSTSNEYFLFENRQQVGFDASLPGHGMLVYHVDGDYIDSHSGSINAGSHQGMYIVSANSVKGNGVTISAQSQINTSYCPFPGTDSPVTKFNDATTPHSNSWAGANTKIPITNIAENSGLITFNYVINTCSPPATQASGISITDVTSNSMTVSWTRGNGNQVLVVARASENDNTNPQDGISYSFLSTVFGNAGNSKIGNDNYVVYNGSGNTVNITGLRSGIDYYCSIYEYNDADYCYKTPALSGHAITLGGLCASSGNTKFGTSITKVVFNSINQISAKPSGYSDYTSSPTSVVKSSAYPLTVNLNTDGLWITAAYVWIDWNHNNSFDDIGEGYDLGKVYSSANGKTQNSPLSITIPSSAIDGLTRMRVSCKDYLAPGACEVGFDGEVEDYVLNVVAPVETTWIGTTADWNTGSNWSTVGVPQFNYNVTIPDVASGKFDPIVSTAGTEANSITIQTGGVLTIETSGSLSINTNLTNNTGTSGLVLKSVEGGTGSLKIRGSVSGSATVNRYIAYDKWHLVSPPATETLYDFLFRNKVIPYLSSSISNLGMTDYGTNNWNSYFTLSTGGSLAVGKGYLVRTKTDDLNPQPTSLNFLGPLKSGATNVSTIAGWNCIGNPFTTAIGINGGEGETSNFMGLNLSKFDPSNACVYVWDETYSKSEYKVINYADTKLYASVGQGFFIKTVDAGTVTFNWDMQVHQGSTPLKAGISDHSEIRLTVSGNHQSSSTIIKFIEGTTRGLDIGYDAGLFKSNDSLAIFTKLVEDNGVKFQFQCLPTNQYNRMVIPVGIDSKIGGEIVFTVETAQLDPNCKVILEDRLTNTFTDLSKETYKTTVAANNSVSDRFFLHTADIVSGLEDQEFSSSKLRAYAVGNLEIRVIGEVSDKSVATLYNGLGKVVLTKKLSAGNLSIIGLPNLGSGVYFLNINDKSTPQTIKVVVRK
jgi:M6 family metalloprotease-like protein